ncbi:MAG TPA: penicillin acylase family protein [Pseudomonadales bacterium]|nr:penicillin acylase family protein [Pseudomonadales bacterium]
MYRNVLLSLLALLALTACSKPEPEAVDPELARLQAIAERVTIIRDDFGVPHIYAKTDADAVFGLLYAQAEDDFARVERNYVWAIGRLAEVQGQEALYSDLRARLFMSRAEAEAAYAAAPDWLRTLCDSFADGLNYYLATHPDVEPALLTHFEPWMPFYFFEGSIGGDIEQIPTAGIEAFYSQGRAVESEIPDVAVAARSTRAPATQQIAAAMDVRAFTEPSGSNGFAIAGSRTRSGDAMLLINPHTSFFFRGEVHVVSEEGLNAYGAVTWGQFFVYQGFNEDTGWMHTSTYVDFMDEFVEDVVRDAGALKYVYGDEMRPVQIDEVTLKVREGDGFVERTFPTYRTHHGPVTHALDGNWVATRINWDPVNALRQSYLRMKNMDYTEFRAMMDIRTNSSNNTVYADSSGNIAYFHGNFIPRRDPALDFSQPVQGSDPGTDWLGLHTVDETIHLLNPPNGWIQNTNSTPFSAAGEYSPKREDYPVYMAPDDQNFRAVHAVQVLDDAGDLTLDSLVELAYDPYLPGLAALADGIVEAWDASNGDPALAGAIEALRAWDRRVAMDSVAMSLAHFYGVDMLEKVEAPADLIYMDRVDWLGRSSAPEERLAVFAGTVARLTEDFGTWETPWGEINRYQRLNGAIDQTFDDARPSIAVPMASGRWGALASFGAPRTEGNARIYGRYGNSFVAVVEFGDKVKAKTILAGGQSGDPASPHFADQAQPYADREFKDAAFYREDVEARATRTYHPGE